MKSKLLLSCFIFFSAIAFSQTKTYWSPAQCMKMKNITAVVPSPDGSKILYTVREAVMADDKSEYVNQVFLSSNDGSNTIQLTKGEKNSSNPQWSPDGKWVTFASAREGKNNLYLMAVAGGEAEKLTDSKSGTGSYAWSNDGNMIAFIQPDAETDAQEKNKKGKNDWYYMDEDYKQNRIYVLWLNQKDSSGKRILKKITDEYYNVNSFDWSPDGKTIAFGHGKSQKVNDNAYSDISTVDVATGKAKKLLTTGASETNPHYSNDGQFLAYTCSEDPVVWGGKTMIKLLKIPEGNVTITLAATPDYQPGLIGWSSDNKSIYVNEANKTLNSIYKLGIDGKEITEWNKGSNDLIGGATLNSTATQMGFVLQNPSKPGEAYVSSVNSFAPQKITNIYADIAAYPIPKTELVKWKSFDGKEIEGLLTYPLNYEAGKKYPLILNIHGGPAGVFVQNFVAGNQGAYQIAAFAEMGMFVLRPNPRGSSGYGKDFRLANQRDWGGGDYKDLMAGVDFVLKMGVADANRLGVMGWSYGGFMSSWVVGHTDRFKVASIGAPVVDLAHQNLTDDIAGFLPSYMKADPWNDWKVYDEHSPLRFIQNVKTPVMLQHGEADARVPISNSVMFYNALKRRNVPVRLLALPRQPHGPTEPKMVLIAQQSNLEWIGKYIGDRKGF
jgi:dipeptidyl aminopeptidase/acylaminoacyl peptidase